VAAARRCWAPPVRLLAGAALVVAGAALMPPAGATVDGGEPNDEIGQATLLPPDTTLPGRFVGEKDVDWWSLGPVGAGLLEVRLHVENGSTDPGRVFLALYDGQVLPVESAYYYGAMGYYTMRRFLSEPANLSLLIQGSRLDVAYRITWNVTGNLSAISGPDEHEPNQDRTAAELLQPGSVQGGFLHGDYLDVDVWAFQAATPGFLAVELANRSLYHMVADKDGAYLANLAPPNAPFAIFAVDDGETVYVTLSVFDSLPFRPRDSANYTVAAKFAADLSLLWEGAGETEPNNGQESGDALREGAAMDGLIDKDNDPLDHFVVGAARGDLVTVTLTYDMSQAFGPKVHGLVGDDLLAFERGFEGRLVTRHATFLVDFDGDVYLVVEATNRFQSYSLFVERKHFAAFEGRSPTLPDLVALPDLGAAFSPAHALLMEGWDARARPVDLPAGEGLLYGRTLCVRLGVQGAVRLVVVEPGLRFNPQQGGLQSLVTSRWAEVLIPSGGPACFRAMSHNETGLLGEPADRYEYAGRVGGDEADVVAVVNRTGSDGVSGQLALWATTSGTDEDRARRWSASPLEIANARVILAEAGVRTPLNPDPIEWVVPAAAGAAAFGVLGFMLWAASRALRPARPPPAAPTARRPPRPPRPGPDPASALATIAPVAAHPPPRGAGGSAPPAPGVVPCATCGAPVAAGWERCTRCLAPMHWRG